MSRNLSRSFNLKVAQHALLNGYLKRLVNKQISTDHPKP